jgi:methylmalonyl-CoA mutase cobalamin-binding subunit
MAHSIVAEPANLSTVGAGPDNAVAGHTPEILFHAIGADHESAGAGPAKRLFSTAGGAVIDLGMLPSLPATRLRVF